MRFVRALIPLAVACLPLTAAAQQDETVHLAGAAYLRLHFGDVELGPGSFLRVRSVLDGEVQELDAAALELWGHSTAYFNGDTVTVEVVAGAGTTNRLVIDRLEGNAAGDESFQTLCGADNRVPSNEGWTGRIMPVRCTGAIWRENSCLVSAGHCFGAKGLADVIQFRVPASTAGCELVNPPVADQFPIVDSESVNLTSGNDWAVATVGTNSLGQTPYERYGELRRPALAVPSSGAIELWGYGADDDQCERNATQQHSSGAITGVAATSIDHSADTTSGNSGSAIIFGGEIIAVHESGGCPQNGATRIDRATFADARAELCIGEAGSVTIDSEVYGCGDTMNVLVEDSSLIGAGTQGVQLSSNSEPFSSLALTEAYGGVFAGSVLLQDVPPSPGDGTLSVQHGDTVTVRYNDVDDGSGAFVQRIVTAVVDCGEGVPSVPDLLLGRSGETLDLTWNNACVTAGPTKILYGSLATVAQHTIDGAVCGIPALSAGTSWNAPAFDLWFVVVKEDGRGVEGSWGQATAGERNGADDSGQCGVTAKAVTGFCP